MPGFLGNVHHRRPGALRPLLTVGQPLNKATLLTTCLHLPTSVLPRATEVLKVGLLGAGLVPQPELQLSHRLRGTLRKPVCSLASVSLHVERNWDPIGDFLVLFLETPWPQLGPRSLLELSLHRA